MKKLIRQPYTWLAYTILLAGLLPHIPNVDLPSRNPSDLFAEGVLMGNLQYDKINELSGLVHSNRYKGYFWSQNDGGDDANVYLIDSLGACKGEFKLEKTPNRDMEDIALIEIKGVSYIFLGEIGDNKSVHEKYFIYCFQEPDIRTLKNGKGIIPKKDVQTIEYQYPDGPRDAEALFVDPLDQNIYIVSKRENKVGIYQISYPYQENEVNIPEKIGVIPNSRVTAADLSPDGKELLIKTYNKVMYWKRENPSKTSIQEMLKSPALELQYKPELQGESIAWQYNMQGYFTISEGYNAAIYYYKRKGGYK